MNEKDEKEFLKDFKDADIDTKLDMWYFALDQGGLWEEILDEMSKIATMDQIKQMKKKAVKA